MYGSTIPVKVPILNLALGGIVSNDNQGFKLFNYIMYTFVYTYKVRWWKWLDAVGL